MVKESNYVKDLPRMNASSLDEKEREKGREKEKEKGEGGERAPFSFAR